MTGTISYGEELKRLRDFLAIFLVAAMVFGAYDLMDTRLNIWEGIQNELFHLGLTLLLSALVAVIGYGILMRMGSLSAERDEAHAERKTNEERFRQLVETSSDRVWEVDKTGTYTYVSPRIRNLLGYEPEEIIGKTPFDLMPPGESEKIAGIFEGIVTAQKPFAELENINLHKDGRRVVLETSGVPFFDDKHTILGYRGIDRDITGRKRAEEALRASSERVQLLLNSTAEAIYGMNMQGLCTLCNAAFLKTMGYDRPEQILGRNIHDLIHHIHTGGTPNELNDCRIYKALLRGEEMHADDEVFWRSDRTSIPVEYWSYPMRKDGIIVGAVVTFFDITERKAAKEQLQKAVLRWQSTFDATLDAICLIDTDQRIVQCNRTMMEMVGAKNPDEIMGRHCWEVVHGTTEPIPGCPVVRMWNTLTRETLELQVGDRWFFITADPVLDEARTLVGAVHIVRDITKRKVAEEQLHTLLREKEILLREIHHRVRNIIQLAVSMMNIEVRRESDKRVREAILGTQIRLMAIASTFNRLYYSENVSRVNLQQVVRSIVDSLLSAYQTGDRTIQTDIHIDITELGVDLALPLALITSELVSNSLRHAFPEGRSGMVTITGSEEGKERFIMTVRDNGSGLPEGINPAEPDTTGLTLVRFLLQQIDGTLSYTSSGEGTSFTITVSRDAESNKSGVSEV